MRRLLLFSAALILSTPAPALAQTSAPAPATRAAPGAPAVPVYGFEVVRTYPHDPHAFTQGLIWRDGILYESTGRSPSTVRKVRLEDGQVLRRRVLDPEIFAEGLTALNGRLFSLTWTDGLGFIWDPDDLRLVGEFAYDGEGWGLTTDGSRLILSDGAPHLRFLDGASLTETGQVPVTLDGRPVGQLNELEWIDGEVWANIWQTDFIVRIDPTNGHVVGIVDLTGLLPDRTGLNPLDDVLNGIAWDPEGRRLFVTGKNWPSLFEIRLTGPR
ncbi:glutaminyl-peptide cyclotransferase [Brevundimonas sp. FT23042]|uniref:glutaminyl-peptide cyclotransferase n=1 Tax=Brevundimonas sp. FT23042 TaxID=3393749 RepID=UPI003B585F42